MDTEGESHWGQRTVQLLVRYEALFRLLDDIQQVDDLAESARRVAKQWKYFANVACWRLVLPTPEGYVVIDAHRGEARVAEVSALDDWDAHHLDALMPRLVCPDEPFRGPRPPAPFAEPAVTQIQVLPFMHSGECIGLLTAAARRQPFDELDLKFIRIFGSHLSDRLSTVLLRRQAMAALLRRATGDALTGLLNRGAIIEQLEAGLARARAQGTPLSIILVDIDRFKAVNDTYGHLAGDQVLREVARRLRAHTLAGDSCGRFGGEEFLFVLEPCSSGEVASAAERLRRVVADTPLAIEEIPGPPLDITISLGTASTDGRGSITTEALLKLADNALYRSKAEGRNRITAG
jgi:diguanylate cyclase (GGDEF)-like protein